MPLRILYRDVDRLPYLLVIRDRGRAHGVDIHLEQYTNRTEDWAEALLLGKADVLAESYWRLQRYHARKAPLLALTSAAHVWTELCLTRRRIASVFDLRGKRIAVRGTGPQTLFPTVLFRSLGMLDDVELICYSERETGRWRHWTKVAEGECDACFMLPLYADEAQAAGLWPVPYPEFAFEGGHVTLVTTETAMEALRDVIESLVRASFEATELVRSRPDVMHAAMTECRTLLSAHFAMSSDAVATRVSELLSTETWEIPIPTLAGVNNARLVAAEAYPELQDYNPLPMWDLTAARAAMRMIRT